VKRSDLVDAKALARLMRAQVHARLPMAGTLTGQHKSPHKGSSVEFAEYRKYVPGDDVRLLDWRVYGRTDRFYLKEFEADTNLRSWLVMDCSASMGYAAGGMTKLDYARRMAAALGYLLVRQGDAVGLTCFAEETFLDVPARRNAAHLGRLFEGLTQLKPRGRTALAPALHSLAERLPRRGMVLIFSDCFAPLEELLPALQHLRFQKHDIAVFQLLDRAELEFDFKQPTRFVDMESGSSLLAEPELARAGYLGELNRFLAALKTGCREFKTEYRQVVTDEDYETAVSQFLADRSRRK
jgi:uncharacterized protein (DUF58 family)